MSSAPPPGSPVRKWPQDPCLGCPYQRTARPGVSFIVMIVGLALALALNAGFTWWALGYHSRQACTELSILASTGGATTSYDQAVRAAYERLYGLRCG